MMKNSDVIPNTISIGALSLSVAEIETTLTILALLTAIILNLVNIYKKTRKDI